MKKILAMFASLALLVPAHSAIISAGSGVINMTANNDVITPQSVIGLSSAKVVGIQVVPGQASKQYTLKSSTGTIYSASGGSTTATLAVDDVNLRLDRPWTLKTSDTSPTVILQFEGF